MNKLCRYMQNYLVYGFIFVIALIGWGIWSAYFSPDTLIENSNLVIRILHELLSYNIMLWFLTLVLYMVCMVLVPVFREKTLKRLAGIKERDEREEYITGKAARASYIATLSLLLFFLFFSLFDINFSRYKTDSQKYKHAAGVGVSYSFFKKLDVNASSNKEIITIFDTSQFSLSSSTIILILLGWQLLVFNLAARRERLRD